MEIPVARQYVEVMFSIPNVQIQNAKSGHRYTYISDLRLNSWPAIWMGWLMGLDKKPGIFILGRKSAQGVARDGSCLIEAIFEYPDQYDRAAFARNLKLFSENAQPLIVEQNGKFRCIDFDWRFDQAVIRPVAVNLSLYKRFIGGDFLDLSLKSLDQDLFGSLTIQTEWNMASPRGCD